MTQNTLDRQTILDTFYTALQDTNPVVRAKAAEALGKLGDVTAIPTLLAQLTDETPLVRSSVARSLGEFGSETILPALVQTLCQL
ncbi:MAG: HEAT repeat domain-containing protein [Cyanobacteriota bacterium]|nr:HEAT repeat domain-containing protein [Cyanobacteriota bacterium]